MQCSTCSDLLLPLSPLATAAAAAAAAAAAPPSLNLNLKTMLFRKYQQIQKNMPDTKDRFGAGDRSTDS
jgi:hypothetical protein